MCNVDYKFFKKISAVDTDKYDSVCATLILNDKEKYYDIPYESILKKNFEIVTDGIDRKKNWRQKTLTDIRRRV